jgi:signal transduction histidine kinase
VLEDCVTAIMSQVKLLRQISAEFSSFASSPTAHPAPTSLAELLPAVLDPYITGLDGRIVIRTDLPASLADDRGGPKSSRARHHEYRGERASRNAWRRIADRHGGSDATTVQLSFADTGTGMDADALRRVFEPYFSTKATGTGLGLTIAKRNVELSGGSIIVRSAAGKGTVVTIELPTSERA